MAELHVTVDGQTAYRGHVDPIILPSRPELYPDAIKPTPGQPAPPLAKVLMLTALIEVMRRTLENPMLGAQFDIETRGMGKASILIDLGID